MTIKLHNSKARTKQDFVPLDPENLRMYLCGPTVYDRAHLGNGRPVVVFDVLYRLLRHVYGAAHVTYVRNFTDVDDKINDARAAVRIQSLYRGGAARGRVQEVRDTTQYGVIFLPDTPPPAAEVGTAKKASPFKGVGATSTVNLVPMSKETLGMAAVYTRMLNTDLWW